MARPVCYQFGRRGAKTTFREIKTVYTVSELTFRVREVLEDAFPFVWVVGELSDLRSPGSGHRYFTLKDEEASIRAVLFRNQARYVGFGLKEGMEVLARGQITVYEPRGEYQLVVDHLEPRGLGLMSLAFEELRARLAEEGLFDAARKRGLPRFPEKVAVVTSPTGAAVEDFIHTARARHPGLGIYIYPARVQGEGAAGEMAGAVRRVPELVDADILVITRGGGSVEDLLPFNDEELVRAIYESEIPVVCAVGHEIDVTLADLAADHRAATPTAAAVAVTEGWFELRKYLPELAEALEFAIMDLLEKKRVGASLLGGRLKDPTSRLIEMRLRVMWLADGLKEGCLASRNAAFARASGLFDRLKYASPEPDIASLRSTSDEMAARLLTAARRTLDANRSRLRELSALLSGMSPLEVLSRGYSITYRLPEKEILRESGMVRKGQFVEVVLASGRLTCEVTEVDG